MKEETTTQSIALRLLGIGLAATIAAPQVLHAEEDMEWEPGEGYHEEEWYDPSDWFNDDGQVDYEYDYDGYDFYDGSWDGYTWYNTYDYAYDFDTESEYVWNDETDSWEIQYDDDGYDYAAKYEFDEDASNQNRNQSSSSQSQSMQGSQNKSQQTMKGTIDAFRKIAVTSTAGYEETHALARISLDNGQSAVVDLGMAALLTSDLSSGDEVTFHGSSGKISGKNVFVATRLTAGDETVYIDRTLPAQGSDSSSDRSKSKMSSNKENRSDEQMSSSSSRSRSGETPRQNQAKQSEQLVLEGKIAEKEVVKLEGESESQTVVKIELQNGKSASVKLGSETSLKDLDLEKGDRISVRGHREQIAGKNIVVAQSIRVEGKKVKG